MNFVVAGKKLYLITSQQYFTSFKYFLTNYQDVPN